MTVFVDASALVAMIVGETEADRLTDLLDRETVRLCSAMSIWETIAALVRSYAFSVPTARLQAKRFLESGRFRTVPIGDQEYELAADAFARYGKGRHPAALNMGDCFACACAKSHGAKLLYKGADFPQTDLA